MNNQEPVHEMIKAITGKIEEMIQQGDQIHIVAGAPRLLIRPGQQPEIVALEPLYHQWAALGRAALVGMTTYPDPVLNGDRVLAVVPSLQIPNLLAVDITVAQLRQITEITGVPYSFPDDSR